MRHGTGSSTPQLRAARFVIATLRHAVLALLLASTAANASLEATTTWLTGQLRADGSFGNDAPTATPFQQTAEAARALRQTGAFVASKTLESLHAEPYVGTEYLARQIIASHEAGQSAILLKQELLDRQNNDGGFGELPGHASTALDTAFALEALALVETPAASPIHLAVSWLDTHQRADGSWSDTPTTSARYTTALALIALQPLRTTYAIEPLIDAARQFLHAGDGMETFETALVALALAPIEFDQTAVQSLQVALEQRRDADGSWGQDVYSTALALRALLVAPATAPTHPGLGSIAGRIVDGQTLHPLANTTFELSGPSPSITASDDDGRFVIRQLEPGDYLLAIDHPEYATVHASITIRPGQSVDFGTLNLYRSVDSNTGTVLGKVTGAVDGTPLGGVLIRVNGELTVTTDEDGAYQIADVTAGPIDIVVSLEGYRSVAGSGTLPAGGVAVFSPALTPAIGSDPETAVIGMVRDAANDSALPGATVEVSGEQFVMTTTDANGAYRIDELVPGPVSIRVSLDGYEPATVGTQVHEGQVLNFSPRLHPAGSAPPDSNTAGVFGVVLDAGSGESIADASVVAVFGETETQTFSDPHGYFDIPGLAELEGEVRVTAEGYIASTIAVVLEPLQTLDLAQIRLRQETAPNPRPDFTVASVDDSQAVSDPRTLVSSGHLQTSVANHGTARFDGPLSLLAFHDTDGNGRYHEDTDIVVGHASSELALGIGHTIAIDIPLAGELPFRDAPITVWADSVESVVESDEDNNFLSTSGLCMKLPSDGGELELRVKWHWDGDDGVTGSRTVHGPPMISRIADTNDDGVINDEDVPIVVFVSDTPTSGTLHAIRGDDSTTLWQNQNFALARGSSPAIGDIDNDGLVEIIVANHLRTRIHAFNSDGSLKWSAATGPRHPDRWGSRDGITIADLDGDGTPEILHGRRVYGNDGALKWQGNRDWGGETAYAFLSFAADVDLDGGQEVIAGRTLYDTDGQVLWHQSNVPSDGFNATGNFDDDDFAEIVLVANSRIYLLSHSGNIVWGPVSLPGGGRGGPPTVADFDGDGEPEIGVAGANYYTVFDTDGVVMWSVRTKDHSSHRTGSSVFDFDGDGKAEVIYMDEVYLFVLDGTTGTIRARIPNGSGTTLEYPLVVDVDNDGQADLVVPSSSGIRVYESGGDPWLATRSIWNQHAYSITNINDDGSIPSQPLPSWLAHNTFRLNTLIERDPLALTDLTASLLRVIDHGTGAPLTLALRLGNAGAAPSTTTVVRFFDGDPDHGAAALGELELAPIAEGAWRDIALNGVALPTDSEIHAVVDPDSQLVECRVDNNRAATPLEAVPLGEIAVATDRPAYGPHDIVAIDTVVANVGALTHPFGVSVVVETHDGEPVAALPPRTVPLASGESAEVADFWHTGQTLSGDYRVRAELFDRSGKSMAWAITPFRIGASGSGQPDIALRVTTDRPIYHTTDRAQLEHLVRNLTTNLRLSEARLAVSVLAPDGEEVFASGADLGELLPGAVKQRDIDFTFANAVPGEYRVVASVSDTAMTRASDSTTFLVTDHAAISLVGSVQAHLPRLEAGQTQTCTFTLLNRGVGSYPQLQVRRSAVRMDDPTEIVSDTETIDLAPDVEHLHVQGFATAGWNAGEYACVLDTRIDDEWNPLDYDLFRVNEPAIAVEGRLELGGRGHLLVLLDGDRKGGKRKDRDDEDEDDDDDERDDDRDEDDDGGKGHKSKHSHHDSRGPSTVEQRAFLEELLFNAGWSYVIVDDADDFASELYSGAYATYLLLSEHEKLAEDVQTALREAVWRGEGLVVGGRHDQRNGRLDPALGIRYRGGYSKSIGIWLEDSVLSPPEQALFALDGKDLRSDPAGATVVGRFLFHGPASKKHSDAAITLHDYGWGRSAYFGYDLLAEAAFASADSLHADLLLAALAQVSPEPPVALANAVVPLLLTVERVGPPTTGRFVLPLPQDVLFVDAIDADHSEGTVIGAFDLREADTATFVLWVQLPPDEWSLHFAATLQTVSASGYADAGTVVLDLEMPPPPTFDALLADLKSLGKKFKSVRSALEKAERDLDRGRTQHALRELLGEADDLTRMTHPEAALLRFDLARLIRDIASRLP